MCGSDLDPLSASTFHTGETMNGHQRNPNLLVAGSTGSILHICQLEALCFKAQTIFQRGANHREPAKGAFGVPRSEFALNSSESSRFGLAFLADQQAVIVVSSTGLLHFELPSTVLTCAGLNK